MSIMHTLKSVAKLGIGLTALTLLLAGCSGSSSSTTDAGNNNKGAVTGVATPSKVSVVNTN